MPKTTYLKWLITLIAWSITGLISVNTLADEGRTISKVGKHCPSGYRVSGEYCVSRSGSNPTPAIERLGTCPAGYRKNGDYCVLRAGEDDSRHVIEKKGACPAGYRTSGRYCVESAE